MTEKTATKIMHGFQISLASLMLICISISYCYHLIAGNFKLFIFCCFTIMWIVCFKMFLWSIREYKEDMAKF